ncbi:MAG: hypothetical protein JRD71_09630 [Deltaproteobacteria bacterium]|nr:hypothetical protein [Deltaproteobacteria bacterium]
MNGYRESDSPIVSEKPSNKTGDNKPVAEKVEKRGLAERNPSKRNRSQAQNWIILPNELDRIRYAGAHARQYLKQEPSALAVHAGICTGGAE